MSTQTAAPEQKDDLESTTSDAAGTTDAPPAEESLIEEVSIDGMCGVY